MTELLYIVVFMVGCALGCVVAMLLGSRRLTAARMETERLRVELTALQQLRDTESAQAATLRDDLTSLQGEYTRTLSALERHKSALEGEQKHYQEEAARHDRLREEHSRLQAEHTETLTALERTRTALEKEQQHRAEDEKRMQEIQAKNFAQFRNLAGEILEQNAGKLKDTNRESMDGLLKPLREQLENLGKAVTHTNETAAGNKASLESAIKAMMEKTETLGRDAENLTLALRGNTKKQGDWGEMILERMLEESGLRKGEEYFVQENHKTEDGRDVRPDVVIRFPDARCVVVDSKVSLTAYALYAAAEKEEDRKNHLSAHVASVRKHIEELAAKDYSSIVEGTISYVLMFMPNEASYMAALQHSPDLPMEAYRRRIILISPTNLLMALQLAYNLWQKERQTRNVEKIFDRATKLYEKMCLVQDSLEKVGKGIEQAQNAYTKACDQLYRGRGNYARQLDDLRQMGISPSKRLKLSDADEVEE